jgi:phospholipid/cholesterol/gamma-HCH transport system ATP-binding protein
MASPDPAGGAPVPDADAVIRIEDLHKSFGTNEVLKGVGLTVRRGSTMVILGGSGSGKSVLMKHMIGLLRPDSGRVIVEGEDLTKLSDRDLDRVRRKFGMVFQMAALFDSMTVLENVAFPLREHRKDLTEEEVRRIVAQKLKVVGLEGIEEKSPAELSGGMRKRVGLARAIVLDPKIVLYDEPTTGLDPITTDYVDDMILTAKRQLGVTSVVISHDIASAFKVADELAVLYNGLIVESGPPEQVRHSTHPHVREFLHTWFEKN